MKNSFIEKIIFVGVMLVSIVACQKHDEDAFDGLISEQVKMVMMVLQLVILPILMIRQMGVEVLLD